MCKIMALRAAFRGFGPLSYMLLGSRYCKSGLLSVATACFSAMLPGKLDEALAFGCRYGWNWSGGLIEKLEYVIES